MGHTMPSVLEASVAWFNRGGGVGEGGKGQKECCGLGFPHPILRGGPAVCAPSVGRHYLFYSLYLKNFLKSLSEFQKMVLVSLL